MLEITEVSFSYPGQAPALNNVSLTIAAGDFIGLAGRNGSGKTTLTRLMVGLAKPSAGQVILDGKPTRECGPKVMARSIGYVFQNPDRQIFRDTVAAEVAYGPEQMEWDEEERRQAVAEALAMTGLTEVAEAYPRGLPRSVRQRIAIASALALRPRLLILDEPTSGQDAEEKNQLMQLLDTLNRQGIGVILVTHDLRESVFLADTVYVMSKSPGRFVVRREIDFPRPRDLELTYTKDFTDIVLELRGHIGALRKDGAVINQ